MRYSILSKILLPVILVFAFQNCKTKTKNEEGGVKDSAALASPATEELNSDQSDLLREVLGNSSEGVFRGIAFGDRLSKVKASETYEMFEDAADHVGYTKETEKLETVDIQYFITADKKVNKITVDIYLNSPDATRQLWNAAKTHFTGIYETPKEKDKSVSWFKNAVHTTMEDVSEGKDYGLKFQFTPDKNILAAK